MNSDVSCMPRLVVPTQNLSFRAKRSEARDLKLYFFFKKTAAGMKNFCNFAASNRGIRRKDDNLYGFQSRFEPQNIQAITHLRRWLCCLSAEPLCNIAPILCLNAAIRQLALAFISSLVFPTGISCTII